MEKKKKGPKKFSSTYQPAAWKKGPKGPRVSTLLKKFLESADKEDGGDGFWGNPLAKRLMTLAFATPRTVSRLYGVKVTPDVRYKALLEIIVRTEGPVKQKVEQTIIDQKKMGELNEVIREAFENRKSDKEDNK